MIDLDGENEEGTISHVRLIFDGVQVFVRTADDAKTAAMFESAYNRLIDCGETDWLRGIASRVSRHPNRGALRHLMICFDEAPCYEFACVGFSVE